jgi:DNA-binding MarR family transcriptional regulator
MPAPARRSPSARRPAPAADAPALDALELERFLPYRLSVLSNRISDAIAREYSQRFALGVTEWRVMAVLGRWPGLTASQVAQRTAMDKVAVSRAVARLLEAGRLSRVADAGDRRRALLRLSREGQAIHDQVVPQARAFEARVLAGIAPAERESLFRLRDAVEHAVLERARLRHDLVVDRLARGRKMQQRSPPVAGVGDARNPAGLEQARDGAAHRDLVHRRALRDLAGGEAGPAPEYRHHPPLGDAQREALRVLAGDGVAEPVRQHAEPVRQETLQFQRVGGRSRAGAYALGGGSRRVAAGGSGHAALRLANGFI